MLSQALLYLSKNLSIVPLGANKHALVPWAEFQQRLPTEAEVTSWWQQFPNANIGIVTGKISDITVVDVDVKSGGLETIKTLALPATLTAKTGGGGWHYYYRYTPDIQTGSGRLTGIDIRNDGGYVVAPPSMHQSGIRYEWALKLEREDFPLDRFPKQRIGLGAIAQGVMSGTRNDNATRFFGKLLAMCKPTEWETFVWQAGLGWNAKNVPPLSEKELRAVYENIAKRAIKKSSYDSVDDIPFFDFYAGS